MGIDADGGGELTSGQSAAMDGVVDGFDPDAFREALVQSEPGIANLAEDIGLQADEFDLSILAEAHLAKSLIDLRRGVQLANDHVRARAGAAQRVETRPSGLHGHRTGRHGIIHARRKVRIGRGWGKLPLCRQIAVGCRRFAEQAVLRVVRRLIALETLAITPRAWWIASGERSTLFKLA